MKKFTKLFFSIVLSCSLLLNTTVSYAQGIVTGSESGVDLLPVDAIAGLKTTDLEEVETVFGEVIVTYGREEKSVQLLSDIIDDEISDISIASTEIIAEDIGENGKDIAIFEVEDDSQTQELINLLNEQEGVTAQPNYVYHIFEEPEPYQIEDTAVNVLAETNDCYAIEQYYLSDYNESGQSSGAGVCQVWDTVKVQKSITVAVLDTGCDTKHPDLNANIDIEHMWDVYNESSDMFDDHGHGTHVCGIIGAEADNEIGIAGASYNANILPIKIFDDTGKSANTGHIIKAYQYLEELISSGELKDLRVINMSLGVYSSKSQNDNALEQIISHFYEDYHILTVAAGGNGKDGEPLTDYCIPSDFDCVLSVTSLDENGGNSYWSDYNEYKDISAPGSKIYSTYPASRYTSMSGTSMAAPLVSGIAALLFAAVPNTTPDDVVDAIKSTAHSMKGKENDRGENTGSAGAIDAVAALEKLKENAVDSDLNEPETGIFTLIDVPTAVEGLVYNGKLQEGVLQGEGYELTGQTSAVEAGEYTAYAMLKSGFRWRDDPDNEAEPKEFTWSIKKKTAQIVVDNASKPYGEKDPELTAVVSGVIEGETLQYSLEREKGENVGDYGIYVVEGDNHNYQITSTSAVFSIHTLPETSESTSTTIPEISESISTTIPETTESPLITDSGTSEDVLPEINDTYQVGKLLYRVTASSGVKKEVSVAKPVKNTNKKITIPETVKINGYDYKVTQIDQKAFYKNKKLTQIVIGKNVTVIGPQAFLGSSKLKKVDIKSGELNKIGTKAFAQISTKAKIYVPKKKYKSYMTKLKKAKTEKDAAIVKKK